MKKLFVFSIAVLFASVTFGQKIDASQVPEPVKQTFKVKFANATDVAWEKEDTVFSSEFKMDDSKTEADFSAKGEWLNTEWGVPVEYTPQEIKDYITKNYAGYKIKEISVSDFPVDGKVYVVETCKKKDCQRLYFSLTNDFKKAEKFTCDKKKGCCKKDKD